MLEPIKHILATKRIVLASGSPRRKQILENIGLKFEIHPSTFEENLDKSKFLHAYEYCLETARLKTLEVADRLCKDSKIPDLIIGADTVVTMNDRIYEKPDNEEHAFEMLSGFSGKSHTVYTGVVLVMPNIVAGTVDYNVHSFHAGTDVKFTHMTPEMINAYIHTGEPMDKAGGYGIQEKGGSLIESINGDYFNVMGFPLHKFAKTLHYLYTQHTANVKS